MSGYLKKVDPMKKIRPLASCCLLIAGLFLGSFACAQAPASFEITEVADNLYRVANRSHRSVFLVTKGGVILADPINPEVSSWLKDEIDQRFGVPVRYVLYSHHHWDHASGGAVFVDTATFVAHKEMARALADTLPSNAEFLDSNSNGILERSEATGAFAFGFDRLDRNFDDELTGVEINADIVPPTLLYQERMKITLGGETVELIHTPPAHSADMTVLYFPRQRTAFGVDFINVRRLPGTLEFWPFETWIQAIEMVFQLDVDVVVPGHGNVGTRENMAEYVGLFRQLEAEISAGIARGDSLEEIQRTADLSEFEGWVHYAARRKILIAAAYANLMNRAKDLNRATPSIQGGRTKE